MEGDKEISLKQVTYRKQDKGYMCTLVRDISSLITFQSGGLAVGRLTRVVGDAGVRHILLSISQLSTLHLYPFFSINNFNPTFVSINL